MTYRSKIVFSGTIIFIISIFIYASFRMDTFEDKYANMLKNKNSAIVRKYSTFYDKVKNISNDSLSVFLNKTNTEITDIALMAVADKNFSIKIASKNERFILTSKLYDTILHDFTGQKFNTSSHGKFIIRYYDVISENRRDQLRFYIFKNDMGPYILLNVFPYKPGKVIITRAVLEILLMLIIISIFSTLLYIIHNKKSIITDVSAPPRPKKPRNIRGRSIMDDERSIARKSASMASDSLQTYMYNLFDEIYRGYKTSSISLYTANDENTLSKLYELRGSSFIKIDSSGFDIIEIDSDTGLKIKQGGPVFLMEGKKVLLPLIYKDSLLGVIQIITNRILDQSEVNSIVQASNKVLRHVSDYLVLTSVMIDRKTGLFSEAYFKMKFTEAASAAEIKGEFSLILISIARTIKHLSDGQRHSVLKMISPILSEALNQEHVLCQYQNFIALLLPGTGYNKCKKAAEKVFKTLQRVRIKVSSDEGLDMDPFIGLSSSELTETPYQVLDAARKNIDLALTRDDGNIQDSKVML